jgi:hypothetical protein
MNIKFLGALVILGCTIYSNELYATTDVCFEKGTLYSSPAQIPGICAKTCAALGKAWNKTGLGGDGYEVDKAPSTTIKTACKAVGTVGKCSCIP